MKKQRLNVTEVAEILIDEIDTFKRSAEEIKAISEKLKSTTVQIDTESMNRLEMLIEKQNEREKQADERRQVFLDEISQYEAKNKYRVPRVLLFVLIGLFVLVMAFSVYTMTQLKDFNLLKAQIEYYQQQKTNN